MCFENLQSSVACLEIKREDPNSWIIMYWNACSLQAYIHTTEQLFSSSFRTSSQFSTAMVDKFLNSVCLIFLV